MNIHITLSTSIMSSLYQDAHFPMLILENRMWLIIFSKDGQCLLIIGLLFSRGEVCAHPLKLGGTL